MHDSEQSSCFTPATALILLSRGALGPAAGEELTTLCTRIRDRLPAVQVETAFVDREAPSLPAALDACAQASTIIIQPVFIPGEHALLRWLRKVTLRWRQRQPEHKRPPIRFAPTLATADGLAELIIDHAASHAATADVSETVADHWAHDPRAWSTVPTHQRHLLFCLGPRCNALGAAQLWQHLNARLRTSGKLQKTVMTLQTSCQYPCNHGPLMIVYPDGTWYGRLDEAALDHILDEHLEQGTVDAGHCVYRQSGTS